MKPKSTPISDKCHNSVPIVLLGNWGSTSKHTKSRYMNPNMCQRALRFRQRLLRWFRTEGNSSYSWLRSKENGLRAQVPVLTHIQPQAFLPTLTEGPCILTRKGTGYLLMHWSNRCWSWRDKKVFYGDNSLITEELWQFWAEKRHSGGWKW